MRRRVAISVLAGVLVLAGATYVLWPRGATTSGPLEVTPNPIDFGAVPWLDNAEKKVTIRNRSSRAIVLRDPTFDCSCFHLTRPATNVRLEPGASTDVGIVILTSKGTPGKFKKTFTLKSDAGQVDVPVMGTISDFRTVSPRDVFLGDVESTGEPVSKTVEVRGGHGYAVSVVDAVTNDANVVVEIVRQRDGADLVVRTQRGVKPGIIGAQVRMTLEVKSPDGSVRRYADSVLVRGTVK